MEVKVTQPLLPLRDIVVFPSMVIPLFVGRDKSITALNEVMKGDKKIVLVTQKNSEVDDPKKNDVFSRSWQKRKFVFHSRSLVHDSFHVSCVHELSMAIAIF